MRCVCAYLGQLEHLVACQDELVEAIDGCFFESVSAGQRESQWVCSLNLVCTSQMKKMVLSGSRYIVKSEFEAKR